MGAQARLIVVLVAQPDLEAVPLGEAAQRPIEDVVLLQPAGGLDGISAAADVALFFCLNDAFRQAAPHPFACSHKPRGKSAHYRPDTSGR